jgi:putative ABC transport system permease protein
MVNWEVATPDYFRAMDIQLLRGRLFTEHDTEHSRPVVIVSQRLAERLWPGQEALGRRLLTHGAPGDEKRPGWQTVVGVVENARYREVDTLRYDIYLPYRQVPDPLQHYVVRVGGDPLAAVAPLKAALAAFDPELTLDNVTTLEQVIAKAFAPWRFSAIVVSALGVMALAFAAAGLAAVMAYAVGQRTREIAVRLALGAQPGDVMRVIAKDGFRIAAVGVAAGLALAWVLRRLVAGMLFGVSPGDGVTFIGVGLLLATVSLVAACLPAQRAARIDPAIALRGE